MRSLALLICARKVRSSCNAVITINFFGGYRLWVMGYGLWVMEIFRISNFKFQIFYLALLERLAKPYKFQIFNLGLWGDVLRFDYLPTFPLLWFDSTPRVRVIRQPVMR